MLIRLSIRAGFTHKEDRMSAFDEAHQRIVERVTERVSAGAEFLDRALPGWERHIDLPTLDVCSSHRCTLAQIAQGEKWSNCPCCDCNNYGTALQVLGLHEPQTVVSYGFQTPYMREYAMLTQQWRIEVVKRRTATKKSDVQVATEMLAPV